MSKNIKSRRKLAAGLTASALLLGAPAGVAAAACDPGGGGNPGTCPPPPSSFDPGTSAPGSTVNGIAQAKPPGSLGFSPGQIVKTNTPAAGQGQP
ncbi:hypothetical protein GGC64_006299 [Mycobacterium sp. OAS707]|uniref:hypothetical protein n=1 Tax=Mycobacterium sp. OAS707 TaxID=2663822 RepID=UPI00178A579A|nr:hypothetical protein [Mycobacterium sp. OAS707]MBE1552212.1 hypothetical protein [Mycobacterium sp. OAS707]